MTQAEQEDQPKEQQEPQVIAPKRKRTKATAPPTATVDDNDEHQEPKEPNPMGVKKTIVKTPRKKLMEEVKETFALQEKGKSAIPKQTLVNEIRKLALEAELKKGDDNESGEYIIPKMSDEAVEEFIALYQKEVEKVIKGMAAICDYQKTKTLKASVFNLATTIQSIFSQ